MENFKTFGSLVLAFISVFTLGAYTYSTLHGCEVVEPHQWILTSLFGIMFLNFFLTGYRK